MLMGGQSHTRSMEIAPCGLSALLGGGGGLHRQLLSQEHGEGEMLLQRPLQLHANSLEDVDISGTDCTEDSH